VHYEKPEVESFVVIIRPTTETPRWIPSSPLEAIAKSAPEAQVSFNDGSDRAAAGALAASCDVAVVFVYQRQSEEIDSPDLSLPKDQDDLVQSIAASNSRTVVVLQTGGAVLMPWLPEVAAVLEAWYPGQRGADAIAAVLFGSVNPSGRLPITFPGAECDLPRPAPVTPPNSACAEAAVFDVEYFEGVDIGYRWFERNGREPLFPFGFGLTYTSFQYLDLAVEVKPDITVSFTLSNTGERDGAEVAQVYVRLPPEADEPTRRLAASAKVALRSGESRAVSISLDVVSLAMWNDGCWEVPAGEYTVYVGSSATNIHLSESFVVAATRPGRL